MFVCLTRSQGKHGSFAIESRMLALRYSQDTPGRLHVFGQKLAAYGAIEPWLPSLRVHPEVDYRLSLLPNYARQFEFARLRVELQVLDGHAAMRTDPHDEVSIVSAIYPFCDSNTDAHT